MHNRTILFSLYLILLLGMSWGVYQKPLHNWDSIAYSAIVLQYNQAGNVHMQVYQAAKQQLQAADYELLASGNSQRKLWATNAAAFNRLMPFYIIKPLYTRLAWLFYLCGLPLFKATVMPSVLAYILTGILLFVWLSRYLLPKTTFALCLIIMLLPNVQEAARLSTPDFLFAFFILLGMYFMIEKKQVIAFFSSLIFAVFCRIDGVILLLALLTFYKYFQNDILTISLKRYLVLTGIAIGVYFTITFSAIPYGWNILYFPSFFKTLTSTYERSLTWHGYVELIKAQLFTVLYYSHLLYYFLLGAILFIPNKPPFADKKLMLTLFITIVLRFILQPVIADRFYLPYYLLIITFVVRHLKQGQVMLYDIK
jgi:hypothetical protein